MSKSQYCRGKKCQKALWLYRHKRELADDPSPFQQNIFDQGTAVGKLATQCFQGGIEVTEDYTQSELALQKTQELLKKNPTALFEAAFLFDDVLIRVDVLRNNGDGSWDLIEVKSTNSVEPKAHYDVAQLEYSRMIEMPHGTTERNEIRSALLKYCERDTLAMVIILKCLAEVIDYQKLKIAA